MSMTTAIEIPVDTTDHPGLSRAEAERRLQQAGPNRLFSPAPVRFWAIAWEEIRELMILLLLVVGIFYSLATRQVLATGAVQTCAFASWMLGHVALAFISRKDREPVTRHGLFSNRVMNVWALAAIGFLLLAVYTPPIRGALRFAEITPRDLLVSAALATLLVGPLEQLKRVWPPFARKSKAAWIHS
ncbi:MAG: cation transporting ATPase C-terminal domain-containing protein [Terriglobia bacterium]|jgi:Ca2+-transporting ATPase